MGELERAFTQRAGRKPERKVYVGHTGYPGSLHRTSFGKLQKRFPERVLELAVKGMLPKGPLGYAMLRKLKIYTGPEHPHVSQQPQLLNV